MAFKINIWPKVAVSLLLLIVLLVSSIPEQGLVSGEMGSGDEKSWNYSVKDLRYALFNLKSILTRMVDGTLQYVGQCGDGALNIHESCEDGNLIEGDGCSSTCTCEPREGITSSIPCPDVCGDGIIIPTEECDDENIINHDGCSSECIIEELVCGNGILEAGEECDGGPFCNEDCTLREPIRCFFCGAGSTCLSFDFMEDFCPFGMYDSLDACRMECGDATPPDIVPVPPGESDRAMCTEPDEVALAEMGAMFIDIEGGTRHISVCEEMPSDDCRGEDCVRLIICRPDGGVTVNVIPCPEGTPCIDGACRGDSTWECLDSDRGIMPSNGGIVFETRPVGDVVLHPDYCTNVISINEQYCLDGRLWDSMHLRCTDLGDYYCNVRERACVPGEIICSETDEDETGDGNNPFVRGQTTVTTPLGSSTNGDDCSFDMAEINEKYCLGNSMGDQRYNCNTVPGLCGAEECRCELTEYGTPQCVPGELPVLTCHDDDLGDDDIFTRTSAWVERSIDDIRIGMIDRCNSRTTVGEAVCVGNDYDLRNSHCPENYICLDGACINACRRTEATDTAGGYVTNIITGEVSFDFCSDGVHLEIKGCGDDGGPITLEIVDCSATGATCDRLAGLCR